MEDKEPSLTMEPLLSPSKGGKPRVKAARFQVASVGSQGDEGEAESTVGHDENAWTHQNSTRWVSPPGADCLCRSHGAGTGDTVQFTHYAKSLRYYLTR
jgi:hypothetical protein